MYSRVYVGAGILCVDMRVSEAEVSKYKPPISNWQLYKPPRNRSGDTRPNLDQ